MSANFSFRRLRRTVSYSAVGPCFSLFSEIRISPSADEMVGMSPCAMAGQLFGMPILSIIISNSSAGMTARISCSMAANRASVSSMRVPAGARAWRRIWPESTFGKKSWPTRLNSAHRKHRESKESRQHRRAVAQREIQ